MPAISLVGLQRTALNSATTILRGGMHVRNQPSKQLYRPSEGL
ncbi:MAG: hypothetical protein WA628_21385 [Terriglobales bacterium]